MDKYSFELFGGAGGLALAIANTGYISLGLVEFDKPTAVTLRQNKMLGTPIVKDWPVFEADVRDMVYGDVTEPVELLAGGPPCQPFSFGGKGNAHNDRRDMFPEAVRAIRELRPKAFIFENVKGLTRSAFKEYFDYIVLQMSYPSVAKGAEEAWQEHYLALNQLRNKNVPVEYTVKTQLLNAANFGVPQKRERIFFVGIRADLQMEWQPPEATHSETQLLYSKYISGDYWEKHGIVPDSQHLPPKSDEWLRRLKVKAEAEQNKRPWKTIRDAISDLPEPTDNESLFVTNHVIRHGAKSYPGHTGSPIDEPSKTIKAGAHGVPGGENMILFPNGSVRYLTVRESARIQTFPDNYVFPVSWGESMRQLGNAVPVELGEAVAKSVSILLNKVNETIQSS